MPFKKTQALARMTAAFWNKDLKEKDWFSVKAADDDGVAEIRIYDVIGWPFVEADEFLMHLDNIKADTIKVRINSPGGSVFEGTAIYNALADHKAKIITQVDSLAASMATIIALAGNERRIYKNAQFMIHNPWGIMIGDYRDFAKESDFLQTIRDQLADVYVQATGKEASVIHGLMDDETWFTGDKAKDFGFMTHTDTAGASAARFDLSMYENAPGANQPSKKDLERILTRDAGMTRSQARTLLQSGFDGINTRDADDSTTLNAVTNLINEIRGKTHA